MADLLGKIIKALIVILGIYIMVSGQFAGLLIIVPALFVDWFIALFGIKATSTFSNAVKILLLVQALLVWFVIQSQHSAMEIFSRPLNPPGMHAMTEPHLGNVHLTVGQLAHMKQLHGKNAEAKDDPDDDPNLEEDKNHSAEKAKPMPYVPNHDPAATKAASAYKPDNQVAYPESTAPFIHPLSRQHLVDVFDGVTLPAVTHIDLAYRSPQQVRAHYGNIFENEMPVVSSLTAKSMIGAPIVIPPPNKGFDERFKNPCFTYHPSLYPNTAAAVPDPVLLTDSLKPQSDGSVLWTESRRQAVANLKVDNDESAAVACLPYVYILGQPKCGTSDLFERVKRHNHVSGPQKKEVRWFTRGEFSLDKLGVEVLFEYSIFLLFI
jgi:hypothetical protein